MPTPQELAEAAPPIHGNKWQPVRGPHLRVVRTRHARNQTGCVGISISHSRDGRTYYYAQLGPTSRRFCIQTLGRQEAFRRAVKARADHEIKVREANAAILRARLTHTHS